MKDTPIYTRLLQHNELDRSSFHTPGHKCSDFLPDDLLRMDYTELPDTDALYEAEDIILKTEQNLARLFGTKRTMISSGGCTLAIQTMLRLALNRGRKMLFARNVHRSAVNAMALLDIYLTTDCLRAGYPLNKLKPPYDRTVISLRYISQVPITTAN